MSALTIRASLDGYCLYPAPAFWGFIPLALVTFLADAVEVCINIHQQVRQFTRLFGSALSIGLRTWHGFKQAAKHPSEHSLMVLFCIFNVKKKTFVFTGLAVYRCLSYN